MGLQVRISYRKNRINAIILLEVIEMCDVEVRGLEELEEFDIRIPCRHNPKLEELVEKVNRNNELKTLWMVQNVNAVDRKGYSDHGPVHMQIVANISLKLGRMLFEQGVDSSLVENYKGFEKEDAEIVLFLASIMHDLGMSIHRYHHEKNSLFLAKDIIDELLEGLYGECKSKVIRSEVLHAIYSHRSNGEPLTVEAGIVRVADALDMEKGRSKITFENGSIDIHSVSAAAVDEVVLDTGESDKVEVLIKMNNSAGIFQVTGLLKKKLENSGIEEHISIKAEIDSRDGAQILEELNLE